MLSVAWRPNTTGSACFKLANHRHSHEPAQYRQRAQYLNSIQCWLNPERCWFYANCCQESYVRICGILVVLTCTTHLLFEVTTPPLVALVHVGPPTDTKESRLCYDIALCVSCSFLWVASLQSACTFWRRGILIAWYFCFIRSSLRHSRSWPWAAPSQYARPHIGQR